MYNTTKQERKIRSGPPASALTLVIKSNRFGGEQPLPPYGCCDLGPINLTKFVKQAFTETAWFDFEAFKKAVATQVRFLDNVLAVTLWPLPQQKKESESKRRIGVGFTGLGNALAMLGKKYDSDEGRQAAANITEVMRNAAYDASVDLSIERGPFPLFNADEYLKKGTFASRLPAELKARIAKNGIRNSHLLSIAPTGTVSLAFADNASNGIEPPFSFAYNRKKRMADGSSQMYPVIDHSLRVYLSTLDPRLAEPLLAAICNYQSELVCEFKGVIQTKAVKDLLPASMVVALEMSAEDHLSMLKVVQPFIDTSISKTVNVPGDYPFEDFKAIYDKAWAYKLKGVSTYRPNAILGSVLSVGTEVKKEEPAAEVEVLQDVNPFTLMIVKRPDNELESVTKKVPYSGPNGDNSLFVSISFAQVNGVHKGEPVTVSRPIEVFITASANGAPSEWVAAHARDLSLIARAGLPILAKALQNSREIVSDKGRTRYGWYEKPDGSKVPRFHGSDVACIAYALQEILIRKGLLDSEGNVFATVRPLSKLAQLVQTAQAEQPVERRKSLSVGKRCPECGDHTLVKKDGCEFCTSCGHTGSCG